MSPVTLVVLPVFVSDCPASAPKLAAEPRSTVARLQAPVENVHVWFDESASPPRSLAPVVIVAVYDELTPNGASGVKIAVSPELSTTVPAIQLRPCETRKVPMLIVAGSIGLLKVAVGCLLPETFIAGSRGVVDSTTGGPAGVGVGVALFVGVGDAPPPPIGNSTIWRP